MDLPTLLHRLHELSGGDPLYLVGGSVRDLLMGRPVKDVDVALPGPVAAFGKRVAKSLGGSFFYLRQAEETARIVLASGLDASGPGASQVGQVDLVALHGGTLEEDLRRRDFTVNAMGLDLTHGVPDLVGDSLLRALVDPYKGLKDLRAGCIRRCTPQSLDDDPLRALRAVRFAAGFGWTLEAQTRDQIRESGPSLKRVSSERIRDELFMMLQLSPEKTEDALHLLATLDLLAPALRGPADPQGIERVHRLHGHVESLENSVSPDLTGPLRDYLDEPLTPPRTRYAVLKLAALFGPGSIASTEIGDRKAHLSQTEVLRSRLELSAAEAQFIRKVWAAAPLSIVSLHESSSDPLTIHRMFKAYRDAVPSALMLSAGEGERLPLAAERTWLNAWFNERERYLPEPLLDGRKLMSGLKKPSGPWLSELLSALQEAQATGSVTSEEEAWSFVRERLSTEDKTAST